MQALPTQQRQQSARRATAAPKPVKYRGVRPAAVLVGPALPGDGLRARLVRTLVGGATHAAVALTLALSWGRAAPRPRP